MKILFCSSHLNYWEQISRAVVALEEGGHSVEVLFDPRLRGKFEPRLRGAASQVSACPGDMIVRGDWLGRATAALRELVNFLSYYRPERRPFSKVLADRWTLFLPDRLWRLRYWQNLCRFLAWDPLYFLLKKSVAAVPASGAIVADIRKRRPDAVVVLPLLLNASSELEYLRAAKAMGIPTAAIIPSWDNLTSKGVFHEVPDRIFVWNEAQREEASRIFSIHPPRTTATGAPRYDRWFDLRPSRTADETARMIGTPTGGRYVIWLCSSSLIASEEQDLIRRFSAALRQTGQSDQVQLVVRPHFQNLENWKRWLASGNNGVHLWPAPEDLQSFDLAAFHQDFFDALHHSCAAIGINTSAFLEAAIAGKPCLTILDEVFRATQTDLPHFRHLHDAGFLHCAPDIQGLVREVSRAVRGEDALGCARRKFVVEFLRPRGRHISASLTLADEITKLASGRRLRESA